MQPPVDTASRADAHDMPQVQESLLEQAKREQKRNYDVGYRQAHKARGQEHNGWNRYDPPKPWWKRIMP